MPYFIYRGSQRESRTLGYSFHLNVPFEVPKTDENAVTRLRNNPNFEETDSPHATAPKPAEPEPTVDTDAADAPSEEEAYIRELAAEYEIPRASRKKVETLKAELIAKGVDL